MPPRHMIDHDNQGMLLPPPVMEGNMTAGGLVIFVEGGFFRDPCAFIAFPEAPRITPEQAETISCLEAEQHALDSLALENRSGGNVIHKANQADELENDFDIDPEDKDEPIADLAVGIGRSETAIEGLKLASKGSLARSLGIEAHTEIIYKTDSRGDQLRNRNNTPQVERVTIVTRDPSEQPRLDTEYRKFRMSYAGTRNRRRLVARRDEIKSRIQAMTTAA